MRQRPAITSFESEHAIICSLLNYPKETLEICHEAGLEARQFYQDGPQIIYRHAVEMEALREPIDMITITERLRNHDELRLVAVNIAGQPDTGASAVSALCTMFASTGNAASYCAIIREKWMLREAIRLQTEGIAACQDGQEDAAGALETVQRNLQSISAMAEGRAKSKTIHELVMESIRRIEAAQEAGTGMKGLPTGLRDLDACTGGLAPAEYIVIQAKRSDGKTALAMTIAAHLAIDLHIPVGIISLEMSGEALTTRLIASRARVNGEDLIRGKLTKGNDLLAQTDPFSAVARAASEIASSPIHIEDEGNQGILEISAKLRRLHSQHGIKAAFIDYLTLMREDTRGEDKRHDRISANSKGLKNLAKELNIPIVVLSQVNADGEVAGAKAILDDADQIWAIWPDGDDFAIRILKQRSGARGEDVPVWFDKPTTTFRNADQKPEKKTSRR